MTDLQNRQIQQLMARFKHHLDCKAFNKIVSAYTNPALAVAAQILSDHVLAEDAVQEAFLRIIRFRKRFDPTKTFSCWFYTILRNICTDMLRQRARHMEAIAEITNWTGTVKTNANGTIEFSTQQLFQSLSASEQAVLNLRINNDMPFSDIATAMGISTEAAKKRAQRGLRRLREKLHSSKLIPQNIRIQTITTKSPKKLKKHEGTFRFSCFFDLFLFFGWFCR